MPRPTQPFSDSVPLALVLGSLSHGSLRQTEGRRCDKLFLEAAMNDENQALRVMGCKPVVVHPGPLSMEDLLRHVDPAPDDETERFVAAI